MLNLLIQKVLAQTEGGTGSGIYNPLGRNDLNDILQKVISTGMGLFTLVFVIMVIYAAFQMLLSRGKPEEYKKGTNALKWAIIGYAAIWCAYGIVAIIRELLTV